MSSTNNCSTFFIKGLLVYDRGIFLSLSGKLSQVDQVKLAGWNNDEIALIALRRVFICHFHTKHLDDMWKPIYLCLPVPICFPSFTIVVQ